MASLTILCGSAEFRYTSRHASCFSRFRGVMILKNSRFGFTVIELLIVLVIMGILTTIAAPNYWTFMAQRRLNGTARHLAMHFMQARAQAITTNKKIIVNLLNGNQYCFVTDNDGDETISSGDTSGAIYDIYPDYYDVTFAAASSGFNPIFRPDGTSQTGTINVSSSVAGITAKTITFSRAGRVKING